MATLAIQRPQIPNRYRTIDPKERFLRQPAKKPYTPPKQAGAKAMTIAVGILCDDGLVLAADRQFTSLGFFKYSAEKYTIHSPDMLRDVAFVFSGLPGLAKEIEQKIFARLNSSKLMAELTCASIRIVVDSVLTDMGRLQQSFDNSLQFFIGLDEYLDDRALLVFDGRSVYEAQKGIHVLGCGGDTSLVRFLSDQLSDCSTKIETAKLVAAYLIKKATQYVDACGLPLDILVMQCGCAEKVSQDDIDEILRKMENQEEFLSTLLVKTPFSLPT